MFLPFLGASKQVRDSFKNQVFSRCSTPCIFSAEKYLRQLYFIFNPENILEDVNYLKMTIFSHFWPFWGFLKPSWKFSADGPPHTCFLQRKSRDDKTSSSVQKTY